MNLVINTVKIIVIIFTIIFSNSDHLLAVDLTGRASSDLYTYTDSSDTHLRSYLRFNGNLTAWRPDNNRALRIHTSLRWRTDLADQLPNDPQLFVYDAYMHLRGLPSKTDIYLGRQFVYSSVGSALIDGGLFKYRYSTLLSAEVYGGSSVSSEDPEKVNSLNDRLTLGGRLSVRPDRLSKINLSWMIRRQDEQDSFHRIGLDAYRIFGKFEAYGRLSLNFITSKTAALLSRLIYRNNDWYLSGEFEYREPSVLSNSIFAIVDFDRYRIIRTEGRRRIGKNLSIKAYIQATLMENEEAWRTGLGLIGKYYSLTWIHQTGYAGKNDGIRGTISYPFRQRWNLFVSANLFTYRVQLEHSERSDSYSSTLGVRYRADRGITFNIEGQYLRNAVYSNNTRLYVRVAKDFSTTTSYMERNK